MPAITRSALLPYSASAMFDLVNDVEAYPRYIDGCVGAQVLFVDGDTMEARLDLYKRGIRHALITRNRLQRPTAIDLSLVDGPFKQFSGRWVFTPIGDSGCKVELTLAFEFNSKLLGLAVGSWFDGFADRLVAAMAKRAQELYGK